RGLAADGGILVLEALGPHADRDALESRGPAVCGRGTALGHAVEEEYRPEPDHQRSRQEWHSSLRPQEQELPGPGPGRTGWPGRPLLPGPAPTVKAESARGVGRPGAGPPLQDSESRPRSPTEKT